MQQVVFRRIGIRRDDSVGSPSHLAKEAPVTSLTELRPAVRAFLASDKFLLVQELIAELAHEEGVPVIEYPIWSPYDAHGAAAAS